MRPTHHPGASLLVLDHDPVSAGELEEALTRVGYSHLHQVADAYQLPPVYLISAPDLLLCNLEAPYLKAALEECALTAALMRSHREPAAPPLLGLARRSSPADWDPDLPVRDLLLHPYDPREVLYRTESLLEMRSLRRQLDNIEQGVEERVRERTAELEETEGEILDRLALAAEYRDDTTGQHTRRVGQLSALVSRQLGLPAGDVALIRRTAPLHDVGKIGLPDRILLKPGKLTRSQHQQMRTHTTVGARMLSATRSPLLQQAATIALTHHEWWNGAGYPSGLQGEAIPIFGRVVAIADVWDALTHDRPYKAAWTGTAALAEVVRLSGAQFDPAVVHAFVRVCDQHGLLRSEETA